MLSTRSVFFTTALVCSLLFSCKKDEDTQPPVITITSPVENQPFSVLTTISVAATVTDNTMLKTVTVQLLDQQDNFAMESYAVPAAAASVPVNLIYYLNNIHLETGYYHLRITASDGTNTSRAYVTVFLNAVPKVISKLLVTTTPVSTQTSVFELDTNYTGLSAFHVFSGDHLAGSASSYYQQFVNCGEYSGAFSSIHTDDHSIAFTNPAVLSVSPYFTGYLGTEQTCFVAYYNGNVRGFGLDGSIVYNATSNAGYFVRHFCFNDNHLLAEEKQQSGGSANLLVSFYTSGIAYQQTPLAQDVVQFCEMDPTHVVVFGNTAGQATIQLFDRTANNLWNPYPYALPPGKILSAVQLDSNTYLLGHSNGSIYLYNYTFASVTVFLSGYTAKQMIVDPVHNELIVVGTHQITSFSLSGPSLHRNINLPADSVARIDVLYNR